MDCSETAIIEGEFGFSVAEVLAALERSFARPEWSWEQVIGSAGACSRFRKRRQAAALPRGAERGNRGSTDRPARRTGSEATLTDGNRQQPITVWIASAAGSLEVALAPLPDRTLGPTIRLPRCRLRAKLSAPAEALPALEQRLRLALHRGGG